ncbi:hypothetical protein SELMODRAFT_414810 [Selaginella moellendorffii]|uniref:Wall-associated receptor kinase galacturonan-binding domain-containing protein n=1 Tax=Selaginella moellendorffii TaxID=88036 RepID=D8RUQ0_SELML|nr:hypothetical protein SELMODRAFT_414810 [Selaginella moellendorffii]
MVILVVLVAIGLRGLDAGTVLFRDAELSSGCGRMTCPIPACVIRVDSVHGCTGGQTVSVNCGQWRHFQEFNDVCQGGALSIDWGIEPLRLQFRNNAGDFEECLLQQDFNGAEYGCNMG